MGSISVDLRSIDGTEAALGWTGGHTIVADRPEGKAGGLGLGFNGAELLALAIGGCFCNDLRYVASELKKPIEQIHVRVTVELDGDPILTKSAKMKVTCVLADGSDPSVLIERAKAGCMVSNSVSEGFPVTIH